MFGDHNALSELMSFLISEAWTGWRVETFARTFISIHVRVPGVLYTCLILHNVTSYAKRQTYCSLKRTFSLVGYIKFLDSFFITHEIKSMNYKFLKHKVIQCYSNISTCCVATVWIDTLHYIISKQSTGWCVTVCMSSCTWDTNQLSHSSPYRLS